MLRRGKLTSERRRLPKTCKSRTLDLANAATLAFRHCARCAVVEYASPFNVFHGILRNRFEQFLLLRGKFARFRVDYAKGSDSETVGAVQRNTGVEAKPTLFDKWVIRETRIARPLKPLPAKSQLCRAVGAAGRYRTI